MSLEPIHIEFDQFDAKKQNLDMICDTLRGFEIAESAIYMARKEAEKIDSDEPLKQLFFSQIPPWIK